MNRESWVDYAKAIGIVLVVYGHVARGIVNAGIEVSEKTYSLIDSILYSFHMPLFFFLSGLFFTHSLSRRGGVGLMLSKVDTVVYPYLLWSILQGCIEVYLSTYTNGDVTFSDVFSLLWEPRAHFWFLFALFYIFLAATLFYALPLPARDWLLLFAASMLYLVPGVLPDLIAINYVTQYLVFFCIGVVFARYVNLDFLSRSAVTVVLLFSFCLAQWWFHVVLGKNYGQKGWETLLLAVVSIALIVSISLQISKTGNKMLRYIGVSSMAIYLMHVLAGSGVRVILDKFMGIHSFAVHLALGFTVAISASLIALWIIERLGIRYVFAAPLSSLFPKGIKTLSR